MDDTTTPTELWYCPECDHLDAAPIDEVTGTPVTKSYGQGRRETDIQTVVCPNCGSDRWHSQSVGEAFIEGFPDDLEAHLDASPDALIEQRGGDGAGDGERSATESAESDAPTILSEFTIDGTQVRLSIEPLTPSEKIDWQQTHSIITDAYEIGVKDGYLYESLAYSTRKLEGCALRLAEETTIKYACRLTDRDDNSNIIVPDDPYDAGEHHLEAGLYHVFDSMESAPD